MGIKDRLLEILEHSYRFVSTPTQTLEKIENEFDFRVLLRSILTEYKIIFYKGDCRSDCMTFQQQLATSSGDEDNSLLVILIPKKANIAGIWGDDWDDFPAIHNAGEPYFETLPTDTIFIYGRLGKTPKIFIKTNDRAKE